MRKGKNPAADQKIVNNCYHHIIMPVYVPNLKGYFENAFDVTQMCIESLINTRHKWSILTVINNGSCQKITNYLQKQYENGLIDQLVHHKTNQGKIDAVIPIARVCEEQLITITDSDVLFMNGWMEEIEKIFLTFKEVGMVSPSPNPLNHRAYTINTIIGSFLKRRIRVDSYVQESGVLKFLESVGRDKTDYLESPFSRKQLAITKNNISAIIGCGHFVSTMHKDVLKKAPSNRSNVAYSSNADREYIDIPLEKSGLWRVSTTKTLAFHIGNQIDDWMKQEISLEPKKSLFIDTSSLTRVNPKLPLINRKILQIFGTLIYKFLFIRFFKKK